MVELWSSKLISDIEGYLSTHSSTHLLRIVCNVLVDRLSKAVFNIYWQGYRCHSIHPLQWPFIWTLWPLQSGICVYPLPFMYRPCSHLWFRHPSFSSSGHGTWQPSWSARRVARPWTVTTISSDPSRYPRSISRATEGRSGHRAGVAAGTSVIRGWPPSVNAGLMHLPLARVMWTDAIDSGRTVCVRRYCNETRPLYWGDYPCDQMIVDDIFTDIYAVPKYLCMHTFTVFQINKQITKSEPYYESLKRHNILLKKKRFPSWQFRIENVFCLLHQQRSCQDKFRPCCEYASPPAWQR